MIERFLKLKNCISKALRVIASTENVFEEEWAMLNNLVEVLRPLEIVWKLAKTGFQKLGSVKTGFHNSDYLATLIQTKLFLHS